MSWLDPFRKPKKSDPVPDDDAHKRMVEDARKENKKAREDLEEAIEKLGNEVGIELALVELLRRADKGAKA